MANISVTYSFTNSTTADAGEVNTNFQDIISGTSDGTKDFSINALTVAGAGTFNGNVTLGNASSDDITFTGSMASSLPVKTTNTHDIGGSSTGLRYGYFAAGGTYTARLGFGTAAGGASWNFTLPGDPGTKGQALYDTDGAGTMGWAPLQTDTSTVTDADYTILDTDGFGTILVDPGSSNRTITLPTCADNTDRTITITKLTADTGNVIVVDDATDGALIDGLTSWTIYDQYGSLTVRSTGSTWIIVGEKYDEGTWTPTIKTNVGTFSSVTYVTQSGSYIRFGKLCWVSFNVTWSAASGGSGVALLIADLPFTAAGNQNGPQLETNNLALSNFDGGSAQINGGDTTISCVAVDGDGSASFYTPGNANSGSFNKHIKATFVYKIT